MSQSPNSFDISMRAKGYVQTASGAWERPIFGNAPVEVKPPPNSAERESGLHYEIIEYCKSRGWIYFHGSMAHRAMRTIGEPDFVLLTDCGRVFFIECKNSEGKLSPQQLALKVWAEKLGHTIHTVRTFEVFLKIVQEVKP